jgi:hypothetical protein
MFHGWDKTTGRSISYSGVHKKPTLRLKCKDEGCLSCAKLHKVVWREIFNKGSCKPFYSMLIHWQANHARSDRLTDQGLSDET